MAKDIDDHTWLSDAWEEWERDTPREEKDKQWSDKYTTTGRIKLPKKKKNK